MADVSSGLSGKIIGIPACRPVRATRSTPEPVGFFQKKTAVDANWIGIEFGIELPRMPFAVDSEQATVFAGVPMRLVCQGPV